MISSLTVKGMGMKCTAGSQSQGFMNARVRLKRVRRRSKKAGDYSKDLSSFFC